MNHGTAIIAHGKFFGISEENYPYVEALKFFIRKCNCWVLFETENAFNIYIAKNCYIESIIIIKNYYN